MRPPLRILGLLLVASLCHARDADLAAAEAALRDRFPSAAEIQFARIAEESQDEAVRARALVGLARSRLALGKVAEARRALQSLPASLPTDLQASVPLVRAEIALLRGETASAREALRTTPAGNGPLAILHTRLTARLLLAENKGTEAEALLRARLEALPDSPELRTELALVLERTDQPVQALELWQGLAEASPSTLEGQLARVRLAEIESAKGDHERAVARIQALAGAGLIEELEFRALSVLANALEASGQFEEAARHLLALEKRSMDPELLVALRLRRAHLLIQAGKVEEGGQIVGREIAASGDHPLAAVAQLRLARVLAAQTNLAATIKAYESYLSSFSDPEGLLEARLGLAALRERQEAWAEAADLYEKIWHALPPDSPRRPDILLKRAEMMAAQGRNAAARELYLQLPRDWPGHPLEPIALFQAASLHPELDPALAELRRLRDRFPGSEIAERALLQQAVLLNRAIRLERALGAYDSYLDQYPDGAFRVDARVEKGIVAYRIGLFDVALREFETVLEQHPEHPRIEQAAAMRAWALFLINRDEDALRAGREFLQKYPNSALVSDMRLWLGEIAFNRGDFDAAEREFLFLAKDATPALRSRALYLAGRAALGRRAFSDALNRFVQSLEADPSAAHAPDALFHQGDALTELNRFDEAIVVFDQLIAQHPGSYLLHAARGRKGDCQFTLGEKDPSRYLEALASYRMVEESSTAAPGLRLQAAYKVGRALAALGRREEARAQYQRAISRFQNDKSILGEEATVWFVRAVTDAAQSAEQDQKWREAIGFYRLLAEAGLPQSAEAARRIDNLRREHMILF